MGRAHNKLNKAQKCRESKMGKKNPMWKGDGVGYAALHMWVKRNKPKPNACEGCGCIKKLEAANKSQLYKRKLSDWEWLCRSCHMNKDGRMGMLKVFNERRKKWPKETICQLCGVSFLRKKHKTKFCSRKCGRRSWSLKTNCNQ